MDNQTYNVPEGSKVIVMTPSLIEKIAGTIGYTPSPNDMLYVNRAPGEHQTGDYLAIIERNGVRVEGRNVYGTNVAQGATFAFAAALGKAMTNGSRVAFMDAPLESRIENEPGQLTKTISR